jgi:hypothetical protein
MKKEIQDKNVRSFIRGVLNNKDIAKEAGINVEDVEKYARKIKD